MIRRSLCLATILGLLVPFSAFAATASPGDLIKASGDAVYYFGADNKRYVFPTAKTYASWYADFSSVKTVTDTELSVWPLGGNVTYRPGVKLVKVTTDPKVYAVSHGGVLRWLTSEAVASSLYGADWATKVDDLPDAFFVNYTIGQPVASVSDYSPMNEQSGSLTIQSDRTIVAPVPSPTPTPTPVPTPTPTPTPTYSGSLQSNKTNPHAGDTVNFVADGTPSNTVSKVSIFFDGVLQRICSFRPCSVDVVIPTSGVKTSYDARADLEWIDGHAVSVTTTLPLNPSDASITLTLTRNESVPNRTREMVATIDPNFTAYRVDFYVDGTLMFGCDTTQQCRYSSTETSPIGTVHQIYAIATDRNNFTRRSDTQTLTVVANDHPIANIIPAQTTVSLGSTVDVTATGADDDGIAWTEVWLNGSMLKHCAGSSCTVGAGPWTQAQSLQFVGKTQDSLGAQGFATSSAVIIQ